jgi:hypothetical protein
MRWATVSRVALLSALVIGCGSNQDPNRHQLSGQVTFRGEPVPFGQIVFEPDTDRGNDGPGGVAEIRQGFYRTTNDFGTVGGPHHARFILGDGVDPGPMRPYGNLLAPPTLTLEVDLPRAAATHDFQLTDQQE